MTAKKQTIIKKDLPNKKLIVTREFDAPLENVWKAWTESDLLDEWWAPKPWKAKTKSMDFREGGYWLYVMEGPDGTQSWCREDYKKVVPLNYFVATDSFCDESGEENMDFPSMLWTNKFIKTSTGTLVEVEITFHSQSDMEKIIEMGFEEGFTAAHTNLDVLLSNKFEIKKINK